MLELGYHPCDADPDLCMKAQCRSEDKLQYYSYILCYVDDILCIHHNPDYVLNKLNEYVLLKPGSTKSPNMYLSTKLKHMQLYNGIWAWSMSAFKYVQEAVKICREYIANTRVKVTNCQRGQIIPFTVDISLYWMCSCIGTR